MLAFLYSQGREQAPYRIFSKQKMRGYNLIGNVRLQNYKYIC